MDLGDRGGELGGETNSLPLLLFRTSDLIQLPLDIFLLGSSTLLIAGRMGNWITIGAGTTNGVGVRFLSARTDILLPAGVLIRSTSYISKKKANFKHTHEGKAGRLLFEAKALFEEKVLFLGL